MECAHLQHHQIKRPKPIADGSIFRRETGIAAEEHGMALAADDE